MEVFLNTSFGDMIISGRTLSSKSLVINWSLEVCAERKTNAIANGRTLLATPSIHPIADQNNSYIII